MKGFLLFDAHCHAHCVAELRKAASVGAMALMSSVEKDWMSLRALCLEDNRAVFGAGIHPWFAHTVEAGWKDRLESFLLENPSAFVGEIGLDKARIFGNRF
jgi:Tat protein secretion system quality control protein TatD with DNase activity